MHRLTVRVSTTSRTPSHCSRGCIAASSSACSPWPVTGLHVSGGGFRVLRPRSLRPEPPDVASPLLQKRSACSIRTPAHARFFASRRDADIYLGILLAGCAYWDADDPALPSYGIDIRRLYDHSKELVSGKLGKSVEPVGDASKVTKRRCFTPYEAKPIHLLQPRVGNDDKQDQDFQSASHIEGYELSVGTGCGHWGTVEGVVVLIAFRDIARSTDERTVIAAAIPRVGTDYTVKLAFPEPQEAPWLTRRDESHSVLTTCIDAGSMEPTFRTTLLVKVLLPRKVDDDVGRWIQRRVAMLVRTTREMVETASSWGFPDQLWAWRF